MSILSFWPSGTALRGVTTPTLFDAPGSVFSTLGMSHTKIYAVYRAMLQRCYDEKAANYCNYGGRGIRVCKRWRGEKGFERFLADMGEPPAPDLTIERDDNEGDYTPANCRWATRSEQGRNKRTNRYVDYEGERRLLIELAEEHGIPYKVLHQRHVQRGWPLDRALTQPLKAPPQLRREGVARWRLVELAEEYDIPYKVLHQRHVQRGWPLERALTEPLRPAPGAL